MEDRSKCPECGKQGKETLRDKVGGIIYYQCSECAFTWIVEWISEEDDV